ncbi:GNAT family N-acetyltransferase [Streptomyces sp. NPDC059740]|uniref:GNAT family N-acetyltransferase n=1 Tax=Streptomyces sp. NPDC059740 TaxID=3346926 RepID=UPI0036646B5A
MSDNTVYEVPPEDTPAWFRACIAGFLDAAEPTEEDVAAFLASGHPGQRRFGVRDGGRYVATYRTFPHEATLPGGAAVTSHAVSSVTVRATHRRRGLLRSMIEPDLRAARERGELMASLIAAEYPIYGRFGFGPAAHLAEWTVDLPRAALATRGPGPADAGRVDFADAEEVRRLGPELHRRFRRTVPGAISRPASWWRRQTGELRSSWETWTERFYALYRSAQGEVEGLVAYTVDDRWPSKQPDVTATVHDLLAVTPAAERALWHHLFDIDWVMHVASGGRAPDDVLPDLLGDPRAARPTSCADFLWLRPLDVPGLLRARGYRGTGRLVLDVTDPLGLAAGRYLLDVEEDGVSCATTTREPDLTLGVGDLARLLLGDASVVRLGTLGRIAEGRAGALERAEGLLRGGRRAWCPDSF